MTNPTLLLTPNTARLDAIEATLQQVLAELRTITARQRRMDELIDELIPIGREAMRVGGQRLAALDERGWTALASALARGLDQVVASYGPEDFEALAGNLVAMTEVVRRLTQPDVLAIAEEAASALQDAHGVAPISMLGALRAGQEDDVQRGMAVLLQVVRQVGHLAGGRRAAGQGRPGQGSSGRKSAGKAMDPRMAARLAPTRRVQETTPAAPSPGARTPTPPTPDEGAGLLAPKGAWSREFGEAAALALGVQLSPEAWRLVEYSRETWERTGSSPNIRALAKGAGVDTRAIYQCFPTAPGRTIARIAGIPKPHGCI